MIKVVEMAAQTQPTLIKIKQVPNAYKIAGSRYIIE